MEKCWSFNNAAAILIVDPNSLFFFSASSHTPVHGARQSLSTRHRKHLACRSLILLLWMLVLQTKSSALKLDPSVSCKKRNLDLKLLLCVCVCFIFSSSNLSLKKAPPKHFSNAIFLKNPTPRSWFYEFPFGRCFNGPLCLKPALQRDGGDVAESASSCLGPLLFLFLTLVFFFVFFTITNTKDPVEKTFCFTGNKKIIYASVKCKNLLPLFIQPNQASLEFTETNRNTQVTFVFLYTTAVRGMKGQSQQTELNCFVPSFRCWWINGETDSHVCLCCSAQPSQPNCPPAPDNTDNSLRLIRWCCSCRDLFVVVVAFLSVPFNFPWFFFKEMSH